MDLSLACADERKTFDSSPSRHKRKLGRVSSDTAALYVEPPQVKFQVGDEESRSRTDLTTFGLRELCERWKSDEGRPPIKEEPKETDRKWKR